MRSAFSFLLSLFMFASIVGVQMVMMSSSESQNAKVASTVLAMEEHEYGMDILQEFEETVEDDEVEFSIRPPARSVALNLAQDDRNELFGPPEGVALAVDHVWVPPQAQMAHPSSSWLDGMLRPPRMGLLTAGQFQAA